MFLFALIGAALAASPATLKSCPDHVSVTADLVTRAVRVETSLGSGSGVVISPDGFILTAAHVTGSATEADIVMHDGSRIRGKVVRSHGAADLALIQIGAKGLACLPVRIEQLAIGADVRVIGSPGGEALTNSVTKGVVSGYRLVDGWSVLQTDASVNPGSSGGMVVDDHGSVIGIISYKAVGVGVEGLGFAIAAENVSKALQIQFGSATDAEIETIQEGGSKMTTGVVEVTNRPARPAKPQLTKKVCGKVDVKADEFNGGTQLIANGANEFRLTWNSAAEPVYSAFLSSYAPIATSPAVLEPGGVQLDMILMDDTRIHLVSRATRGGVFLAVDFPMSLEAVEAIAAVGPKVQRWTIADVTYDQERSERQRASYYQPAFSCLYQHLTSSSE